MHVRAAGPADRVRPRRRADLSRGRRRSEPPGLSSVESAHISDATLSRGRFAAIGARSPTHEHGSPTVASARGAQAAAPTYRRWKALTSPTQGSPAGESRRSALKLRRAGTDLRRQRARTSHGSEHGSPRQANGSKSPRGGGPHRPIVGGKRSHLRRKALSRENRGDPRRISDARERISDGSGRGPARHAHGSRRSTGGWAAPSYRRWKALTSPTQGSPAGESRRSARDLRRRRGDLRR
ncbi:hypothetical protein J2W45_000175 [Leifsonia shinshuensis]|nr:hypothetical protein [Leifsonia shinshuensis]